MRTGNVLKVWICGAQTAGSGDHVLEGRVDSTIGGNHLQKPLGIGGAQLGEHPVVDNGRDDGVLVLETFQYINVGGVAGFCLFAMGEPQGLEQQRAQLLGGIDINGPPA